MATGRTGRSRIGAVVGALGLAASLLAGCSSGGATGPSVTPASTAAPSSSAAASTSTAPSSAAPTVARATVSGVAPASLAARCGPDPTQPAAPPVPFTFATADGQTLLGVEFGAGGKGVVALHELGTAGLCGWVPFARQLAQAGLHVLVFDHRCVGLSTCPDGAAAKNLLADTAAARAELIRRGATTTALLGSSRGGGEAIAAAASQPGWTRAAVLSGALFDLDLGGGVTATSAIGSLRVPVLFLVNGDDQYSPLAADRALVAKAPAGLVALDVTDVVGHGWVLLQVFPGETSSGPGKQVTAFLSA